MTQHKPPQAMTLFDLLARTWTLPGEVRDVIFNAAGSSLAVLLADGRLAFISVKDAEHPESRVRIEADTGRTSIRPRTKTLPAPVLSDAAIARADLTPCRLGDQGFAFSNADTNALWRATARGQTLAVKGARNEAVTALASIPRTGRIVLAYDSRLALVAEDGGAELATAELSHGVSRIAVSDDGRVLGCLGGGQISIVASDDLKSTSTFACEGEVLDLGWSPCKRWLVAGCANKTVLLIDVQAGVSDRIVDFPDAVRTIGFSNKARAMIASGAFRVVGWTLPDLPFGDDEGSAIETGKPGLTLVDLVAVHPKRDLCAVSYANGLVMICRIGHPDEMLLREGSGATVNSLAWSDDGAHLAIGGRDGSVSIATFPKNMFK
ncbi:WD40 repeat domain-containing protein [Primorskyibacter flagellatus]|uniref:WD domain-containing protein, G-beta repeat-containing protein n=1 Tax=Primorskyibacter flagellatus TaxID=1387277 RepID=A0A1W2DBL7_9RHOB|nr:hypothetical protein [Primorskyibacter flagellatus]SMC94865.1 WD domain-containing protein, G-beta repeat-containing protein [Primorskyibacter flagellatus]